jgi:hypothetical protein
MLSVVSRLLEGLEGSGWTETFECCHSRYLKQSTDNLAAVTTGEVTSGRDSSAFQVSHVHRN